MTPQELELALEAVLFSASHPLSVRQLSVLLPETSPADLRGASKRLNAVYEETGRAFRIETVAEGLQMRTLPEHRGWVQKLDSIKTIKLSMALLETLAIVAYKQPITRAGVEFVRGVDSSHTLRTLLQRRLIRIVGKEMLPGRPSLYGTTKTFLEVFGLSQLKHLPDLAEFGLEDVMTPQLELPLEAPSDSEEPSTGNPNA